MPRITLRLFVAAVVALLPVVAHADTIYSTTLYCTGGTTCSTSNSGLSSYWTLATKIDVNSGASTFTFQLTVSETGEATPGYFQDFSSQMFYNGSQLTNLAWIPGENPGSWTDLQASKAGNSGSCNGNTPGALCGSEQGTSGVLLGTSPLTFGVSGSYTGTFGTDTMCTGGATPCIHLQAAAGTTSTPVNNNGGNLFAITNDIVVPASPVPEPASMALFGTGLFGLAGIVRRRMIK